MNNKTAQTMYIYIYLPNFVDARVMETSRKYIDEIVYGAQNWMVCWRVLSELAVRIGEWKRQW